jgi:hypothetical protein
MRKILLISLSNISSDSRVLRQITALLNNNFFVITAGFGNLTLNHPNHIHIEISPKDKLKFLGVSLLSILNLNSIKPLINFLTKEFINKLKLINFDLIISNDLHNLPVVIYLSQINNNKPIILDIHEYFIDEYSNKTNYLPIRKIFYSNLIKKYKKELNQIKLITVNESIAKLYQNDFNLNNFEIILNCPYYYDIPSKLFTNNPIKMVNIGIAIKTRKLENLILLFNHIDVNLRSNFELDFYLIADNRTRRDYLKYLKKIANKIENIKINFFDPIPPNEVVPKLSQYDIGLSYVYPSNLSYLYSLPNKLFQYIQARLAILSSPNPEMAKIVSKYNLGFISQDYTPLSLANTLLLFNKENINKFKENSNKAARIFNYDNEASKFINLINKSLK